MTRELLDAVINNDKTKVQELINKKVNLNVKNKKLESALVIAGISNFNEIFALLLSSGADPNITYINKNTPLITATQLNNINQVKLLLLHKADPNITNIFGDTALMTACWHKHIEIIKLLKLVTNITILNNDGESALTIALKQKLDKKIFD